MLIKYSKIKRIDVNKRKEIDNATTNKSIVPQLKEKNQTILQPSY